MQPSPWHRMSMVRGPLLSAAVACGLAALAVGAPAAQPAAEPPLHAIGGPTVVASGLPLPANLAFDTKGNLWVVAATLGQTPSAGVWYLPRSGKRVHVRGLAGATALTWVGNEVYVAFQSKPGQGRLTAFGGFNGIRFARHHVILDHLSLGAHYVGTILPGPGGRLFIGLGAAQNLDGPSGRILSFPASGGATTVEATGLRTSYGLAFWGSHLLATVNGPDQAGKSPDEIVSFEPSGPLVNFGFPKCYGQGGAACSPYPKAFVTFPSHSTPAAIVVKGDAAFVADNGSGDPSYPARSEIVRIDLRTGHTNVFWRSPVAHDLTGLAIGPDGDLYANGVVSGKILRFKL